MITLPPLPSQPESPETGATPEELREYDTALLRYQDERALYYQTVQTVRQNLTEQQSAATNLSRSNHDAMMAIVRNLR